MEPYLSIEEKEDRLRRPIKEYPALKESKTLRKKDNTEESVKSSFYLDDKNTMLGKNESFVEVRISGTRNEAEKNTKLQPEAFNPNAVHGNRDRGVYDENSNKTTEIISRSEITSDNTTVLGRKNYDIASISELDRTVEHTKRKLSTIYFTMPASDGSFEISNGETFNNGKKYYRIEFEEFSTFGELYFIPSDKDQRAINRLETYLKPVCIVKNIANSKSTTKIKLIKPGKVYRSNDRWVIDPNNKTKIELY